MLRTSALAALVAACTLIPVTQAQPNQSPPTTTPAEGQPTPAPKIVVDPPSIDLGKMSDDKGVHGEFSIRNDGDADLQITGITSTCGCTIPNLGGRAVDKDQPQTTTATLKPGESVKVDVEFHPAGKRGKQDQKVTVRTNDPARREVVVDVLATVQPIVATDPNILAFGDVERDQPKTLIATITGQTPDFAVPMVTTGSEYITARILDTTPDEEDGTKVRRVRIEFTVAASKAMTIVGTATIRTNDRRRRIVSLPMSATVLGDLALEPAVINLGAPFTGEPVEKSIRLHTRSGASFQILNINERGLETSPATWKLVEAGPDAPAGAMDLLLSFTAPPKQGPWTGTLVLTTDVPEQEKVEVAYRGTVRKPPPVPRPAPATDPISTPADGPDRGR